MIPSSVLGLLETFFFSNNVDMLTIVSKIKFEIIDCLASQRFQAICIHFPDSMNCT